jgi:hypothetical protein
MNSCFDVYLVEIDGEPYYEISMDDPGCGGSLIKRVPKEDEGEILSERQQNKIEEAKRELKNRYD